MKFSLILYGYFLVGWFELSRFKLLHGRYPQDSSKNIGNLNQTINNGENQEIWDNSKKQILIPEKSTYDSEHTYYT